MRYSLAKYGVKLALNVFEVIVDFSTTIIFC